MNTEYEASLKTKIVPSPVNDRSGATNPSPLRRSMDQQKNTRYFVQIKHSHRR